MGKIGYATRAKKQEEQQLVVFNPENVEQTVEAMPSDMRDLLLQKAMRDKGWEQAVGYLRDYLNRPYENIDRPFVERIRAIRDRYFTNIEM